MLHDDGEWPESGSCHVCYVCSFREWNPKKLGRPIRRLISHNSLLHLAWNSIAHREARGWQCRIPVLPKILPHPSSKLRVEHTRTTSYWVNHSTMNTLTRVCSLLRILWAKNPVSSCSCPIFVDRKQDLPPVILELLCRRSIWQCMNS